MQVSAAQPGGGLRSWTLAWGVAMGGAWILGAAWADAWTHLQLGGDDGLFSPVHLVLYMGLVMVVGVLVGAGVAPERGGWTLRLSLPYRGALAGAALFAAAAAADAGWHAVLGSEQGLGRLLSPTHLFLGLAGLLILSAPFHEAWRGSARQLTIPAAVSLAATASLVVFFTQYTAAYHYPWPAVDAARAATLGAERASLAPAMASEIGQVIGASALLLQTAVVVTPLLLTLRRFEPPPGAVFLVAAWSLALPAVPHAAVGLGVAGLIAAFSIELAGTVLKPRRSVRRLRSFAALAGALIALGYVSVVAIVAGLAWPPEVWTGLVLSAAGLGLLLALLAGAPAAEDDERFETELRRQ